MVTKYKEIDNESRIAVNIDKLIVGERLAFHVFINDNGVFKPLFNKGMIFTSFDKSILQEKNISEAYIDEQDKTAFHNYISKNKNETASLLENPSAFKEYSFNKEQYHQIDKRLLEEGIEVNFSLFSMDKFKISLIAEAAKKWPVKIDKKILSAEGDIMINKSDIPLYEDYLISLTKSADAVHKNRIKAIAIKENSKVVIKNLLDNPRSGENIKKSQVLVNNIIDCILQDRDAIYDLLSLRNYDYYTYTHSINVAVLSIGLGTAIELKRDNTEKLGIGAMLHDIGKSSIPHEILNKQGKLNSTEYTIMKNHVIEGEKILLEHKDIPDESLIAVLQHHEKLTGKGYPLRLSGNEIKLFGRIAAIADCYDALTTRRPYKPPFIPFYALSVAAKGTGDYDPELLKIFIKMLGKVK